MSEKMKNPPQDRNAKLPPQLGGGDDREIACKYCGYTTTVENAKLPFADKVGKCCKCGRRMWEYKVDWLRHHSTRMVAFDKPLRPTPACKPARDETEVCLQNMSVLQLEPGDVIVVRCPECLSKKAQEYIENSIQKLISGDHKVFVLENGMDIGVLKKSASAGKDVESAEGGVKELKIEIEKLKEALMGCIRAQNCELPHVDRQNAANKGSELLKRLNEKATPLGVPSVISANGLKFKNIRDILSIRRDQKVRNQEPEHGPCCTCQTCGYNFFIDCQCENNAKVIACEYVETLHAEIIMLRNEKAKL